MPVTWPVKRQTEASREVDLKILADGERVPDAVEDNATGLSFYVVDVSIDSKLLEEDGSVVEILPGMVASVDVLAGKRTVLDYVWNPMLKIKERALTD